MVYVSFIQIAYHKAKELILIASIQYIQKSLFDLQHQPDESHNVMENVVTDLRGIQLMMNELHDDHNLTVDSIDAIEKVRQMVVAALIVTATVSV